jgi:secreted trypsin-like serine protease
MNRKRAVFVTLSAALASGIGLAWWQDWLPESDAGQLKPQIVGGSAVKLSAHKNVVGITYFGRRQPECTGSLIAPSYVLTAAHCLCGVQGATKHVMIGNDPIIGAGATYYKVISHKAAMSDPCRGLKSGVDLAVLKLENPVSGVVPHALAEDALTNGATQFRIVGFGAVNTAGTLFTYKKQEAAVPAISIACNAADDEKYNCQQGKEIVAGQRNSPDTCKGDSGGPLLVSINGDGGLPTSTDLRVAGVTSRGVQPSPATCGYGGIYERVDKDARLWISDAIRQMGG